MIRTLVLFDMGQILVQVDHERMHTRIANAAGIAVDDARAMFERTKYGDSIDRGRLDTYRWTVRRALGLDHLPDRFLDQAYVDIHTEPHQPVVDLKRRVMAANAVGLLTNSNRIARDAIERKWPGTLRVNGPSACSDTVGALKPDPEIYEILKEVADHIVYVDDLPENLVYPATKLGWHCIRYTGLNPAGTVPAELQDHPLYREAGDATELSQALRSSGVILR